MENYKITNAEMSKKIIALEMEVTRLKDEKKIITVDLLCSQNEVIQLKKQIVDLKRTYVDHASVLACEVQSFVLKMNQIFVNQEGSAIVSKSPVNPVKRRPSASNTKNDSDEILQNVEMGTTRNTMQSMIICHSLPEIANLSSTKNSLLKSNASNTSFLSNVIPKEIESDDFVANRCMKKDVSDSKGSRKMSLSYEPPVRRSASKAKNGSDIITDEIKENCEIHFLPAKANLDSAKNLLCKSDAAATSFMSDAISQKIENVGCYGDFVRSIKEDVIHSNEDVGMSCVSTPNKRNGNAANTGKSLSESNVCDTEIESTNVASMVVRNTEKSFSTLSNGSTVFNTETKFGNGRPKRKAALLTSYKEQKINSKLRRPLSIEPKLKKTLRRPLSVKSKN